MKPNKLMTVTLICLILIGVASGCASKGGADDFTMSDLTNANTLSAILDQYSSVRAESIYYDIDEPGTVSLTETRIVVKRDGEVTAYSLDEYGSLTIKKDGVYVEYADGTYFTFAFIDDGMFENGYLPYITDYLLYVESETEELVSSTVSNGIRTVTAHDDIADWPAGEQHWGLTEGRVEHVYEVDIESGLIQHMIVNLLKGDSAKQLLSEHVITYGQDDNMPEPEYVTRSRDMSVTRTRILVRDPNTPNERTFTFTIPKQALLILMLVDEYEHFEDAEFTIPFTGTIGEPPDELTTYIRKAG